MGGGHRGRIATVIVLYLKEALRVALVCVRKKGGTLFKPFAEICKRRPQFDDFAYFLTCRCCRHIV